jgi:hypothetical protein
VIEGSACDESDPNGRQDVSVQGPSAAQPSILQKTEQKISAVLRVLDQAEQLPDLLERNTAEIDSPNLQRSGIESDTDDNETVTLAAYLFSIAGTCRDTARSTAKDLHKAGWTKQDQQRFERAFENLRDVWTTYQSLLRELQDASWGGEPPTPGQVLEDLERPRRRFIAALDIYRVQLRVALNYETSVTGPGQRS